MEKTLHNKIYLSIASSIKNSIDSGFDLDVELDEIYELFSTPPNDKLGQIAFPCFSFSKTLRMGPPQISAKIAEGLKSSNNPYIKKINPTGPYLNFELNISELGKNVFSEILSGEFFKKQLLKDPPATLLEYSQPNTHKELHVGHMRNLCLGNTLSNLYKYTGHNFYGVTYPGDVGTHVAKCLWYLKKFSPEKPKNDEDKGSWLGNLYSTAHNKLESERGTETEESNRAELTKILKEIESGQGEYFDLWTETRVWSLDLMKKLYSWAGVEFDRWYFESEMDSPSVDLIKKYFDEGKLTKDQGAIGMDLSEDKLGFCLLLKSDGNGLYATKDVLLAQEKFKEFNIQKNLYIVDVRQSLHFKQVFKVLEKVGFEQAQSCHHIDYEFVEVPDGAMSSRKGNIVPLMDLIKNMEDTITKNYLEKYRGDWSDEEISSTAKDIANGAIKYGMVRMDNNRKIVFEMNEWLKLDGESGPYLQYVYARINSLCNKLEFEKVNVASIDWGALEKNQEVKLAYQLTKFNDIVVDACLNHKTPLLTSYLYDTCKLFNSFYAECSVANAETPNLKNARLAISKATAETVKYGLSLLGVNSPQRM